MNSTNLVEKYFDILVQSVPGATVLSLFYLCHPSWFHILLYSGFLGYKTKLTILFVLSLLIGLSLDRFAAGVGGTIGYFIGARQKSYPFAFAMDANVPWRDRRWRKVAGSYLGSKAPKDTFFITSYWAGQRRELIARLPAEARADAQTKLESEISQGQLDDYEWALWYKQFHIDLKRDVTLVDFSQRFINGFNSCMATSGTMLVIGTIWVPAVRNPWCYAIGITWALLGTLLAWNDIRKILDPWQSLDDQIRMLASRQRGDSQPE